eukprot:11193691-Lingulodinium_polyedra.AAC.1
MTGTLISTVCGFLPCAVPAQARRSTGIFPHVRTPPQRGTSEFERQYLGGRLKAMVDDGAQIT